MTKRWSNNPIVWLQIALVALLLTPILAQIYIGQFARPMADDYCFANIVYRHGVGGALVYWYQNWTGGYGSVLTQSIAALFGSAANALLPPLLLILWLAAVIVTIYHFAVLAEVNHPRFVAFWLGALFVYGMVQGSPNILQSLDWTSASLSYTAPLVMLAWYAALTLYVARRRPLGRRLWVFILLGLNITFFAGGASETFMMLQGAVLGLSALVALVQSTLRRSMLPMLVGGLVGAVIAIFVTVAAPGNMMRYSRFSHPLEIPDLVDFTMGNTRDLIVLGITQYAPVPLLVSFAAAAWLGLSLARFKPRYWQVVILILISAVIGFGMIFATLAPAAYGMTAMPPRRAFIVPHTVLVGLAIWWGILLGLVIRRVYRLTDGIPNTFQARTAGWLMGAALIGVILLWGPVQAMFDTLANVPQFSTYAAQWDSRDQSIRAAVQRGETTVTVAPFSFDLDTAAQVQPIGSDPSTGFNACAAHYYGLQTLKTE